MAKERWLAVGRDGLLKRDGWLRAGKGGLGEEKVL